MGDDWTFETGLWGLGIIGCFPTFVLFWWQVVHGPSKAAFYKGCVCWVFECVFEVSCVLAWAGMVSLWLHTEIPLHKSLGTRIDWSPQELPWLGMESGCLQHTNDGRLCWTYKSNFEVSSCRNSPFEHDSQISCGDAEVVVKFLAGCVWRGQGGVEVDCDWFVLVGEDRFYFVWRCLDYVVLCPKFLWTIIFGQTKNSWTLPKTKKKSYFGGSRYIHKHVQSWNHHYI